MNSKLQKIRREYGNANFNEKAALPNPIDQFKQWFAALLKTPTIDPSAMVVATVDSEGKADARVLLLKDIINDCFVFYTNYLSAKALQIEQNNQVALNFYWPELSRQVRVRGTASKTSAELSDKYFSDRPRASQLSAIASPQSQIIKNREILKTAFQKLDNEFQEKSIQRPAYWGGYQVKPDIIEF